MTAESVRAILDGKKTQTRRVMEPQPNFYNAEAEYRYDGLSDWGSNHHYFERLDANGKPTEQYESVGRCRYGAPGDRLWVREAWCIVRSAERKWCSYKADFFESQLKGMAQRRKDFGLDNGWKSPMLMPRRLSRITLEITNVRCERVMSMWHCHTEKEGYGAGSDSIQLFRDNWNSLNAKRGYGWETNPYVWVVSFKMIEGRNQ